ncbi:hypothetical protein RCL1_004547 [Eukaryota sp. TZLM3-RCL]
MVSCASNVSPHPRSCCYNCLRLGHRSRYCPYRSSSDVSSNSLAEVTNSSTVHLAVSSNSFTETTDSFSVVYVAGDKRNSNSGPTSYRSCPSVKAEYFPFHSKISQSQPTPISLAQNKTYLHIMQHLTVEVSAQSVYLSIVGQRHVNIYSLFVEADRSSILEAMRTNQVIPVHTCRKIIPKNGSVMQIIPGLYF